MSNELVPQPTRGRTFVAERRVRLSDVTPRGRLRLDAIARYLQDLGGDDTADAGLESDAAWVVRRSIIRVAKAATFREWLTLTTWCSGIGGRWAERRTSISGREGASIEAASLWVHIDIASGRPARLPGDFAGLYGEAAGGRTVRVRLVLPPAPEGTEGRQWPLRAVDFDLLGHVNNAVYWMPVEEELDRRRDIRPPFIAVMEFGAGIRPGDDVRLVVADEADAFGVWLLDGETVPATARIEGYRGW